MRSLPLLLLLAACPTNREVPDFEPATWPESEAFVYEGALFGRAAGHALGADSLVVGIDGQTVLLRPATREVEAVVEAAPGIDEIVLATTRATSGPVALVQTPTDVRLVIFDGGGIRDPWVVPDVLDGDVVGEAPVVLYRLDDECRVRWVGADADVGLGVDCDDGSNLVALDGETVVVALGGDGVHRATAAGVTELAERGLWVDWDGAGRLYFAGLDESGGIVVADLDGVVERTIPTERPLLGLAALADRGVVWIEDHTVELPIRWADPLGELQGEVVHDQPIIAITASPDGTRIGVQRQVDVGTYEVTR